MTSYLPRCGLAALGLMLGAMGMSQAEAQELEPRSYTNLPIGETFMVVGAARSEGDISPANSTVIQDLELTIDTGVMGFAHSFALGQDSGKLDLAVGRTCYEGSAIFQGEFVEGALRIHRSQGSRKLEFFRCTGHESGRIHHLGARPGDGRQFASGCASGNL